MNREGLNWLLQTIKDAEAVERFVLAQYERGRISFQMMTDVSERTTRRRSSYGQQAVTSSPLPESAPFSAEKSAYGHSYLSERMFGGVTRTVLREAGLPVLMSR